MSYFRVVNIPNTLSSGQGTVVSGNYNYTTSSTTPIVFSRETGFRTRVPNATSVVRVPDATADPYSYFMSLNQMKVAAAKQRGFSADLFREDRGHPWDLEKFKSRGVLWEYSARTTSSGATTFGKGTPHYSDASMPAMGYNIPTTFDLRSWAALVYGQASPTSDRYSLPSFVGELDRLPSLLPAFYKDRGKFYKNLGSDYLNAQFGWLPFLDGLREIATALAAASYGLFRPWGAYHRSRKDDEVRVQRASSRTGNYGIAMGAFYAPSDVKALIPGSHVSGGTSISGTSIYTTDSTVERWYEAEYVYLPEPAFDNDPYLQKFDTLMKTNITAADLWELAPWSWLVDWFLKIGKAIESYETATTNRILSTYAYAMEKTTVKTRVLSYNFTTPAGVVYTGPKTHVVDLEYTRMRRIRANPFGFTLNPTTQLTAGQMGILGALGLTQVRR